MSFITLRDFFGVGKQVKTTLQGTDHIPHHNIDAFPAQLIDAFSRGRVSTPGYRADSQLTYRIDTDLWDQAVFLGSASGTSADGTLAYDSTNRLALLTAKAGTTGSLRQVVLQFHYHAPYSPGRGQLVFVTGILGDATSAGGEVGMGYYDGSNGVYLRRNDTGVYVGIKTTTDAVDQELEQADWNLDTMDGNGPSGLTLDLTKGTIMVVQMQALYVGMVVVGFDIAGNLVPVHAFYNANELDKPYIAQASLPVRYWASALDTTEDVAMSGICCSVISEGGADLHDMQGRTFVSYGENTDVDAAAEAVLVIRPKEQLNGINQNAVVIPTELDVSVSGAGCWIEVRVNATITGGTFTDVNAASTVEESFAGNAGTDPVVTAGTGTLIDKFYLPASSQIRSTKSQGLGGKVVICYSHLRDAADNIAIMGVGGNNSEVRASLKWKEIR